MYSDKTPIVKRNLQPSQVPLQFILNSSQFRPSLSQLLQASYADETSNESTSLSSVSVPSTPIDHDLRNAPQSTASKKRKRTHKKTSFVWQHSSLQLMENI